MSSPVGSSLEKHDGTEVDRKRKRDPAEAPVEHHNERHSKKKKKDGQKRQTDSGNRRPSDANVAGSRETLGQPQSQHKKKEKKRNGQAQPNGPDDDDSGSKAGPQDTDTKGKESRRARKKAKKHQQKALSSTSELKDINGHDTFHSSQPALQKQATQPTTHGGIGGPIGGENGGAIWAGKKLKNRADTHALSNELLRNGWKMSAPSGGRFIDQPACLSAKEDRLLCATENGLDVYITSNSLLEHSLKSPDGSAVTSFSLSSKKQNVVFMSTASGLIVKWNFQNATSLGTWATDCQILDMSVASEGEPGTEVIYTISKNTNWKIQAHRLGIDNDLEKTKMHTLLQLEQPIQSFQVLDNGSTVVAITDQSLIVGKRNSSGTAPIHELRFGWREIDCGEPPRSFDVRLSSGALAKNRKRLNVAVGGNKGAIYVYQDLLVQLGFDNSSLEGSIAKPTTKLHWHREEVGSLAWSKDGNYLISGGMETVLVLWQLDTGKKQYLPHLESPVQSITISPSGASYVVRLGDNSVMVLSTSELKPTTHVANLQTTSLPVNHRFHPEVPTLEMWTAANNVPEEFPAVQAAISSQRPHEVLAAVSSYQRDGNFLPLLPSAPYLQTFDTSRSRHVARQALTRTMATHLNIGPDGNRIAEPHVKLLKVSANGKWMATIDEWSPHSSDLEDFASDPLDIKAIVEQQRTIQLRIWSWKEKEHTWALNSRIDSPHMLEDTQTPGKVLGLVASPATSAFATIGQDSKVKIWEPKTRLSNSQVIHGESKDEQGQTSWSVRREIPLETGITSEPFGRLLPQRASLAYTGDGSTLVANQHFESSTQHSDSSLVHFIDVDQGFVCQSRSDVASGISMIYDLGFLGQYLICLGVDSARVWNVTSMEQHAQISLPRRKNRDQQTFLRTLPLLAVNASTSTFAIAAPISTPLSSEPGAGLSNPLRTETSEFCIYSLMETNKIPNKPIWRTKLPRLVLSLLSAGGIQHDSGDDQDNLAVDRQGYVTIDAGATVRTLRPLRSVEMGTLEPATTDEPDESALAGVDMAVDQDDEESSSDEGEELAIAADAATAEPSPAERPVVASQQLARLFDHPTHALPPLQELLGGVLRLFAPKRPAAIA